MKNNIIVKNLTKYYDEELIFNKYNCEFKTNEYNIIMGSSGIGKTTLLHILMGIDNDYTGQIINIPKSISPIFQENRLLEDFTVYTNLKIVNDSIKEDEIDVELSRMGLEGIEKKKIRELSGGMKRRITILRAIMKNSEIYIFDEPFKELDESTYYIILKYIEEKLTNKTVILSTHRKEEIEFFNGNLISIK